MSRAKEIAKIAGVATVCFIMIAIGSQVGSHLQAPTSTDDLTIAEQAELYDRYDTFGLFPLLAVITFGSIITISYLKGGKTK